MNGKCHTHEQCQGLSGNSSPCNVSVTWYEVSFNQRRPISSEKLWRWLVLSLQLWPPFSTKLYEIIGIKHSYIAWKLRLEEGTLLAWSLCLPKMILDLLTFQSQCNCVLKPWNQGVQKLLFQLVCHFPMAVLMQTWRYHRKVFKHKLWDIL